MNPFPQVMCTLQSDSIGTIRAGRLAAGIGNQAGVDLRQRPRHWGGIGSGLGLFSVLAVGLGTGTLNGSGVATYTATSLAVGSHSITAGYGGDTRNDGSNSNAITVTVTLGATTTSLKASATSIVVGSSVTFTATVTGASGVPAPTGSVTFANGATTLATGTLSASGTATYSTSALAAGSYNVTASYGGDSNNASSTSSALAFAVWPGPPNFSIFLAPSSGSFKAGTPATVAITVTSVNGFASATNLGCGSLPKDATCTFSQTSVTPGGSGTATSTLTINTDTKPATAELVRPNNGSHPHAGRGASGGYFGQPHRRVSSPSASWLQKPQTASPAALPRCFDPGCCVGLGCDDGLRQQRPHNTRGHLLDPGDGNIGIADASGNLFSDCRIKYTAPPRAKEAPAMSARISEAVIPALPPFGPGLALFRLEARQEVTEFPRREQ